MKKILRTIALIILLVSAVLVYLVYDIVLKDNAKEADQRTVFIQSDDSFDDMVASLTAAELIHPRKFRQCAKWMKFSNVKSGKYVLHTTWSNRELINHLRQGLQQPVNLVLRPARFIQDIAGQASKVLEADSAEIVQTLLTESFLGEKGVDTTTVKSLIVPNTYEFFWNTNAKGFVDRMFKENERFWATNNRSEKAKELNLTKVEVVTLASIVERESQHNPERPTIAGLYLNRLRDGIPLQADPTVIYATGEFGLRRVLYKHLRFESPYNTYRNQGLPPGPIYIPSIQSIDAVLNAQDHDYYFMCAKPDAPGQHAFAKTLREHNQNARIYRNWLNARGIR